MPGYGASLNQKIKTQLLPLVGCWIRCKYQFLCLLYIDVAWEALFRHSDFRTFFSQANMVPEQKIDFSDIFVLWLRDRLEVATLQWELKVREELHKNHRRKRVWLITKHLWTSCFWAANMRRIFVLGPVPVSPSLWFRMQDVTELCVLLLERSNSPMHNYFF